MVKKKAQSLTLEEKKRLVGIDSQISINRQCELMRLNRSSHYYHPEAESRDNLMLMRLIDEEYTRHPFYGKRKMTAYLKRLGHKVNVKRIRRLMQLMNHEAIYQKPNLSRKHPEHTIYPYLLKGLIVDRAGKVWSTDITYIRTTTGFMYLVAVIDWHSRYVLAWRLSNTLDAHFCIETLKEALKQGTPEIFNTDQGVQFTSHEFIKVLTDAGIKISMDGKGRALDNIFVERLWRTVKYENIYLHEYETARDLLGGLEKYFFFYNHERLHESLDYKTPHEIHAKRISDDLLVVNL